MTQPDPQNPSPPSDPHSQGDGALLEERRFATAQMMTGVAMMFVGFLNILLSISGGFEINIVPFLLYFAGLGIWAHATIVNPSIRYAVITATFACALAFFHYGEVLFWHKQVVFWATIAMVLFFMFTTADKPEGGR